MEKACRTPKAHRDHDLSTKQRARACSDHCIITNRSRTTKLYSRTWRSFHWRSRGNQNPKGYFRKRPIWTIYKMGSVHRAPSSGDVSCAPRAEPSLNARDRLFITAFKPPPNRSRVDKSNNFAFSTSPARWIELRNHFVSGSSAPVGRLSTHTNLIDQMVRHRHQTGSCRCAW
jgi:hypothetical protein